MSNLKELTWDHHQNAERQEFVKVLMSGKINPEFYATYLYNQWKKYQALEEALDVLGVWADDLQLFDIKQMKKIEDDWQELWDITKGVPLTLPSTHGYLDRIEKIKNDKDTMMAHVYVLHMGDLSGGQMIKRKIPGEGRMYQFEGNAKDLKENLRSYTHDGQAEEAKYVFDSATNLFQEMMEVALEYYMD